MVAMAKAYTALLLLCVCVGTGSAQQGFTSIDCGAARSYRDGNSISWVTDNAFVASGSNAAVVGAPAAFLQTLRYFPDDSAHNCYLLPVSPTHKYLLRASFYYGNYDNHSFWPSFDLLLNGNLWQSISRDYSQEQSLHDYLAYEAITSPRTNVSSLCLKGSVASNIPFISALELRLLSSNSYSNFGFGSRTFYLTARQNLGANTFLRYPRDVYDRIWYPVAEPPAGCSAISTSQRVGATAEFSNKPPATIFSSAFQGPNNISPLNYTLNFLSSFSAIYVDLYFWDFRSKSSNDVCAFDIVVTIDGVSVDGTLNLGAYAQSYSFYADSGVAEPYRTLEISLVPLSNSTLPPVLNAIEVYVLDIN